MASYVPAFERLRDLVVAVVRLVHRMPPLADEEAADIPTASSSQTSISSAGTDLTIPHEAPLPTPASTPRPKKPIALPSFRRTSHPAPHGPGAAMHITSLPPELHVLILRHLTFADIQRLRHTSRFYRHFITKRLLRDVYGPALDAVLLSHCHLCHVQDPARATLLYADVTSPSYPFCSTCVPCAARRDELFAGRRVSMGNFRSAWVCRWCGLPVVRNPAWREPLFHQRCYSMYGTVLLAYLLLGWVQLCVAVAGAALCFRYFRGVDIVLGPCIAFLVVAPLALLVLHNRCPIADRTYRASLILEFILFGLWIPPTYGVASSIAASAASAPVPKSSVTTLAFCGLNLTFRLLNVIGNVILLTEPPLWRRKKPGLPFAARLGYLLVALMVFWTYPRAVEQSYRPRTERERKLFEARRH